MSSRSLARVPCAFRRASASRRVIARSRAPARAGGRRPQPRERKALEAAQRPSGQHDRRPGRYLGDQPGDGRCAFVVEKVGVVDHEEGRLPGGRPGGRARCRRGGGRPVVPARPLRQQRGLSVPDRGDDGDNRVRPGGTKAVDEGSAKCRRRGRVRPLHWTPHSSALPIARSSGRPLLLPRLRAYRPTLGFGWVWEVFHDRLPVLTPGSTVGYHASVDTTKAPTAAWASRGSDRVNAVIRAPCDHAVTGNTDERPAAPRCRRRGRLLCARGSSGSSIGPAG